MKRNFLKNLGRAIISGIPFGNTIKEFLVESKREPNIDPSKQKEGPNPMIIVQLIVEGMVIIGVMWVASKLGLTTEDIKDLFGLLK